MVLKKKKKKTKKEENPFIKDVAFDHLTINLARTVLDLFNYYGDIPIKKKANLLFSLSMAIFKRCYSSAEIKNILERALENKAV